MYHIAALYKFFQLDNPSELKRELLALLVNKTILGTLILGYEGINGTISGPKEDIQSFIKELREIIEFGDLDIKFSNSKKNPFIRLKIKIKKEIVTIGEKNLDPIKSKGDYIEPEDWNALLAQEDVFLIDVRNNYEHKIGKFQDSVNPKTNNFREFPEWVKSLGLDNEEKSRNKIAMFCTGGIRCEKASSYMKREGFEKVYQLKGGILKYLEKIEEKKSLWKGECFVFDERVSVKHDLSEGSYDMCHACRMPLDSLDKESEHYVKGISCSNCYNTKSNVQKKRYASRQLQVDLAKARDEVHIGPKNLLSPKSIK